MSRPGDRTMKFGFPKWLRTVGAFVLLISMGRLIMVSARNPSPTPEPMAEPRANSQLPPTSMLVPKPIKPSDTAATPYPTQAVTPVLYQADTHGATETALVAADLTKIASVVLSVVHPAPTLSPSELTARIQDLKNRADITLERNGQTFTYTISSRFFVFLDDVKYPVRDLTCEPRSVIGYVSNGQFRGPHLYPDYYEAVKPGTCTLRDRDFAVTIVVVEPNVAPSSAP